MSLDIQGVKYSLLQHYKIEEKVLEQLLILEKKFREHNALMKSELAMQKDLVTRFWVLSQRYIVLENTAPGCRIPEIYAGPAEDALMAEFGEKLKALRKSNCVLCVAVRELRISCKIFEDLCSQLDMSVESPFIVGDTFHKPLSFFIELVRDLFEYFNAWILKLKYTSHLIDPLKSEEIESYQKLVESTVDFDEYLNVGLTYCKCLKPRHVC